MYLFHNIGQRINSNYNLLSEVISCAAMGPISFDGIYKNVWDNRECLRGLDVTMFIMGAYVGKDNSFDTGQKLELYCSWDQLMELHCDFGFKWGWHTWTHPNLTKLTDAEIIRECTPPFPMDTLAYPYGDVDERVSGIIKSMGYKSAWSVHQGSGEQWERKRQYFGW